MKRGPDPVSREQGTLPRPVAEVRTLHHRRMEYTMLLGCANLLKGGFRVQISSEKSAVPGAPGGQRLAVTSPVDGHHDLHLASRASGGPCAVRHLRWHGLHCCCRQRSEALRGNPTPEQRQPCKLCFLIRWPSLVRTRSCVRFGRFRCLNGLVRRMPGDCFRPLPRERRWRWPGRERQGGLRCR